MDNGEIGIANTVETVPTVPIVEYAKEWEQAKPDSIERQAVL